MFVVALALALPALLLLPVQIYGANPYDFKAALVDLLPGILSLALATTLVLTLIAVWLPQRFHQATVSLLLALAVLVWVHGQLIVHDYGVLDGSAIDWTGQPLRLFIDASSWLLVLSAAWLLRRHLASLAPWLAAALLLMHAVPAWQAWRGAPQVPDFHRYNFDASRQFSFSSERNVVVIVLDAFQSDVFQRILAEDYRWSERLEGFTFFRNALAGYAKTYPSLALMLGGDWYDNDRPLQAHIRQSFRDDSVPALLRKAGWHVDLHPAVKRAVDASPRVASNAVPSLPCPVRMEETGRLGDLGLFRVSPHWLKPVWLNDYDWRLASWLPHYCSAADDGPMAEEEAAGHAVLRFLSRAERDTRIDLEQPSFKLYHLLIPHAPFRLDSDLSLVDLPTGRDGFVRQSRAALEVVSRLLTRLREEGVYDRSLIAVVSDHGGGEYLRSVDLGPLAGAHPASAANSAQVPPEHVASGLSLVLIKPPGVRGPLRSSDAPVSLGDLAATLASLVGLDAELPGRNMFEIAENADRDRFYRHYRFTGFTGEFLPPMTEYRVRGFSWLAGNWAPTGRVLAPAEGESSRTPFPIGEPVRYREGSSRLPDLVEGWSVPEQNGMVWSRARRAVIELPLPDAFDASSALRLRLDYRPYAARGRIENPRVRLGVNGRVQQEWQGGGRAWRQLTLPPELTSGTTTLRLEFELPDAASPANLGLGADVRSLGIALYGIELLDERHESSDDD
jgi:hypothetical protein